MVLILFSYIFIHLNLLYLPADVEAAVRVGIPPLGLDRDEVLLSELSRDRTVLDFGRAKKKFYSKNENELKSSYEVY
jgi:hypothetical protein